MKLTKLNYTTNYFNTHLNKMSTFVQLSADGMDYM